MNHMLVQKTAAILIDVFNFDERMFEGYLRHKRRAGFGRGKGWGNYSEKQLEKLAGTWAKFLTDACQNLTETGYDCCSIKELLKELQVVLEQTQKKEMRNEKIPAINGCRAANFGSEIQI
ncbi:MAG: hypothetical protein ONB11_12065 [candidate division KSB1 bacterium]|nr:hypothetical protein [candidate division KSB1 bacterium]